MAITGYLIGQFAASIAPVYFTFFVGVVLCSSDILRLDYSPAVGVLLQYVCLPALLFIRIAETPTSELDLRLLGADAISKLIPFVLLLLWWRFFSKYRSIESLEWVITLWMLSTLPNPVLIGDQVLIPLFQVNNPINSLDITSTQAATLSAAWTHTKTTNIIFAQCLYWYNLVILMMEIRDMLVEDEKQLAIHDPETPSQLAAGEGQKRSLDCLGLEKSRRSWEMGTPENWEQSRLADEARPRPTWEMGRPKCSKGPFDGSPADLSNGSMTPTSMTPYRQMLTPSRIFGSTPSQSFTPSQMMTPGSVIGTPTMIVTPSRLMTPSRNNMTPSPMGSPMDEYSMQSSAVQYTDGSKSFGPEFYPQKPGPSMTSEPTFWRRLKVTSYKMGKRMLYAPTFYGSLLGFIWSLARWPPPTVTRLTWVYNSVAYCAGGTIALAFILLGMIFVKNLRGAKGWIPCGWKLLFVGFIARFIFSPIAMYIGALAFNLKHAELYYAILQEVVPQGLMTFALAQIYGIKTEVMAPA